MIQTELHLNAVTAITSLTRAINPEIGLYKQHFMDENHLFIRLTNGTINISIEAAQDFEAQPSNITNDRIESIARTFRKI